MSTIYTTSNLQTWLQPNLKFLKDLEIKLERTSEKGDGYFSDMLFVSAGNEHHFALKCSKKRTSNKDDFCKKIFLTEIYIYETIFADFTKFQQERGLSQPFDSFPPYFGKVLEENREIIILQDLSKLNYRLYERRVPMTRKHIELIIGEYAKLHSISIAMQNQEPERYKNLIQAFDPKTSELALLDPDFINGFIGASKDVPQLFENELDAETLKKLENFSNYIADEVTESYTNDSCLKVICHDDCWNNNFMFQTVENPTKVAIVDWQGASINSPIYDLSYYLFVSISEEDLKDINSILDQYYDKLSKWLENLGSNSNKLYPKHQFLADWRKFCKVGFLFVCTMLKICTLELEDAPDVSGAMEEGNFSEALRFQLKNPTGFKNRLKPIIKYVVEQDLI